MIINGVAKEEAVCTLLFVAKSILSLLPVFDLLVFLWISGSFWLSAEVALIQIDLVLAIETECTEQYSISVLPRDGCSTLLKEVPSRVEHRHLDFLETDCGHGGGGFVEG